MNVDQMFKNEPLLKELNQDDIELLTEFIDDEELVRALALRAADYMLLSRFEVNKELPTPAEIRSFLVVLRKKIQNLLDILEDPQVNKVCLLLNHEILWQAQMRGMAEDRSPHSRLATSLFLQERLKAQGQKFEDVKEAALSEDVEGLLSLIRELRNSMQAIDALDSRLPSPERGRFGSYASSYLADRVAGDLESYNHKLTTTQKGIYVRVLGCLLRAAGTHVDDPRNLARRYLSSRGTK